MSLFRPLRALFRKEKLDAEMSEEMRMHLELQTRENVARGVPSDEARHAAQRSFGGAEQIKERCRDERMRGLRWLDELFQDLRYAGRMAARNPGFTTVILVTLALGIGANAAIFSLLDAVLWKMLPVSQPEQLVFLDRYSSATPPASRKFCDISYPLMEALERRSPLLDGATTARMDSAMLTGANHPPEPVKIFAVAGDFYSLLGVGAAAGRVILDDDVRASERVAVLSHAYWRRRFGGEPVLGGSLTLNGVPHAIVGVMPREFFGVIPGETFDVSVPFAATELHSEITAPSDPRASQLFWVLARLKRGVNAAQASESLTRLLRQIVREDGPTEFTAERIAQLRVVVRSERPGLNWLREKFSQPLVVLMALAGAVLLIACANVANLLLARATARSREMAIRASVGAGRARLVRQLVTESLALALAGGALGLLVAQVAAAALVRLAGSGSQPIELEAALDFRVLAFTAAVSVLTGVLFGLAPAWKSADGGVASLHGRAKRGGGTLSFPSRVLISAQVALSLVLLAGAGLFVRSLQNLRNQDTGFRRDHLLLVRVNPQLAGIRGPQLADLYAQVLERATALPGVVAITFQRNKPFTGEGTMRPLAPPGYTPPDQRPIATPTAEVGPRYFETLGMRLIAGRDFRASDDRNAPKVVAINEAAAREFFPGRNPIGARIGPPEDRALMEVIAVGGDALHSSLRAQPGPMVYEPVLQNPRIRDTTFFVRTTGDAGAFAPQFRQLVHAINPNVPVMDVTTLEGVTARALVQERLLATLASVFGGLALVLAAVGLSGVLLFAVSRRTHEIGIRMALGATRAAVVKMVLGESLSLVGIGVVMGIPCALVAGRMVQSMLFGLSAADPATLVSMAALLVIVGLVAAYWPALRAGNVEPIVALRTE